MDHMTLTDADIARSHADPRFKQVLLAKSLEQLLDSLYRLQHAAAFMEPAGARNMREGAAMAVHLADMIRELDDALSSGAKVR